MQRSIHLFQEGSFYRAYVWSAWLVCRYIHEFKVTHRIMAKIDSMATQLTAQGAMNRNSQAWPRWGQYVWPNQYIAQNFNDEVSHLKSWIHDRLAWMDQQLGFNPNAVVYGDVNCDGEVTAADITCLYNYLLEGDQTFIDTSDVDGDGEITTVDITIIYNIMLGNE